MGLYYLKGAKLSYDFTQDYDEVLKLIKQFIATSTSLNVYTHRTNFIKPEGQYATVWLNNLEPIGLDNQFLGYDDTGRIERAILYKVTATISIIRSPARPQLMSVIASLETPEYGRFLSETNNVQLLKKGILSDSSAVLDGDIWEDRASTILEFNTYFTQTDPTPTEYIESVGISQGDISNDSGTVLSTIEKTINYP